MKFGQLIEYNKRNILIQKSCRIGGTKTSPRPLFVFKKALYKVNASGLQYSFSIFRIETNKNKVYKTVRPLIQG